MKKTILITGSNGQLGRSLVSNLSNIFNIVATSKNKLKNVFKLDITNKKNVKENINKIQPDIIINCAAITDVDYCKNNHDIAWRVNTSGLENIIKFSNKNTKIIQFSTDYVFNGLNAPYSEEDSTYPINYYGKSKLAAENILIGSNRKFLILRLNALYTSDLSFNNFFSWIFWSLKEKKIISIVSDQISNPSFVDLLPNVITKCILMQSEGIFHYGSDNYLSRYEFALQVCETFNFSKKLIQKIKTAELDQDARRPLNSSLKTDKIENILGLKTYRTKYCLEKIKNML